MNVEPGHLWAIAFDGTSRAAQFREKITSLSREKRGLILLDVALAIRYEDGSFTLNGESFPLVKHMPPRTLAHLLAGLALGAPPLCSAGVSALLGVVGFDSAASESATSSSVKLQIESSPGLPSSSSSMRPQRWMPSCKGYEEWEERC